MKKGRLWALAVFTVAIITAIDLYVKHLNYPPDGIDPCKAPLTAKDCNICGGPENGPSGGRLPDDGYYPQLCCPSGYYLDEYKGAEYCFRKKQQ